MRFWKTPSLLMVLKIMILILPLSGKKMTALPRPLAEDMDVVEAHTTEVGTVASIIMGNVENIKGTMAVTVEDTVEATVEAREVASEDTEAANEFYIS